jgi:hypothetical protein
VTAFITGEGSLDEASKAVGAFGGTGETAASAEQAFSGFGAELAVRLAGSVDVFERHGE